KIGVIAPLSGDLTATGTGIRNSVELAIRQANEQNKVPGWRIELAAEDDAAKPDVGAQAAAKLASDSAVVGVIGTYNSSVALQVAPVLDRANVVQVSPGNTNDTLTRGENFRTNPVRPHKNYFRTATLDSLQGGFAADYAAKDLGFRTAAIIHDKKAYGQGIADSFRGQFERNGGRIVATETINPGDKDFSAVLTKIKPLNPDLIFYGGEYPEASLISNQAKGAQGMRTPLMGGDGIVDPTYTQTAGNAANGDFGTSVGAPPEQLPSARQFIQDYQRAGFRDSYSAYGALAYDAANAIISTLPAALGSANAVDDEVRRKVIEGVGRVSFAGASGQVAFDAFGDTVTKTLTMYKVEGGQFRPVKTGEFAA
ncbi:MAG TPA: branched-chain amino acid ABC transporter substrate-binding protein, partial [Acidimicrobiales bacterium]|nr:branched-chain amino acid ABC transporter substrate-binding protein [Acidimicrobiales bacterium]